MEEAVATEGLGVATEEAVATEGLGVDTEEAVATEGMGVAMEEAVIMTGINAHVVCLADVHLSWHLMELLSFYLTQIHSKNFKFNFL
jgi:hypothetical protein